MNTFLSNLSVSTELNADIKPAKTKTDKKSDFENFMNDVSKEDKINNRHRDDNVKKDEIETSSSNKKVNKEKSKASKSDTERPVEKTQSNSDKEVEATEVEKIAEELNIAPERVMEILAELNITIEDLNANSEVLTELLVEAFEVESPIDLLNIPNIREIMSNLKDIVASEQNINNESMVESTITTIESNEVVVNVQKNLTEESLKNGSSEEATQEKANTSGDEKVDVQNKIAVAQSETKSALNTVTVGQSGSSNAGLNQETESRFIPTTVPVSNSSEARTTFLKTEAFKNINPQDVIKQMTETLKTDIRNGVSEIKIVLRPEQLGDIPLKLLTENGIITAKFVAESEKIKEIIESNFDQLRNSLEEQGISVSELSVSVGQEDRNDRMQQFLKEQQKSSARIKQIISNINANDDLEAEQVDESLTDSSVDFTA